MGRGLRIGSLGGGLWGRLGGLLAVVGGFVVVLRLVVVVLLKAFLARFVSEGEIGRRRLERVRLKKRLRSYRHKIMKNDSF